MHRPLRSLREGSWFKLICGASFQHLPAIRSLALAYTLAGADCVDVAADPAVVAAASEGIRASKVFLEESNIRGFPVVDAPWLMVSFNDGEDPHFRKAELDASVCPSDCLRPCESICPAQAIAFGTDHSVLGGVITDRCYGCGRCLPVCPIEQIQAQSHLTPVSTLMPLLIEDIDAIEIHTQIGRGKSFEDLWRAIAPFIHRLKLVAISCPDGDGYVDYLWELHRIISPLPCPVVWQTDGRPMSGDIGAGTTHAAIRLSRKVLEAGPPGYVQLAGGTNRHTVTKLEQLGMLNLQSLPECQSVQQFGTDAESTEAFNEEHDLYLQGRSPLRNQGETLQSFTLARTVAGVAYGSYARTLLSPVLEYLEKNSTSDPNDFKLYPISSQPQTSAGESAVCQSDAERSTLATFPTGSSRLEACPDLLWQAVALAHSLTSQLKSRKSSMNVLTSNQLSIR